MSRVAVTPAFFGRHPILREELLARYPDVTFKEDDRILAGEDFVDFLRGHDKVIMSIDKLTDDVLAAVPELKVVAKHGVGLDSLDLEAMARRGVELGWRGGVNRRAVAELALSFIITVLRNLPLANRDLCQGVWERRMGSLLTGKTVGIIGCGFIGKELVLLLQPFDCKILVNDIRDYPDFYKAHDIETVGLEELLERSDVVSLHTPLDETTRNILSPKRLALMKPTAILINTARGGLVDEAVLKAALKEGRLWGAAFDAFAVEPLTDTELYNLPNFWATPHMGANAEEVVLAMGRSAIAGLDEHRPPGPDWLDAWPS